MGLRNAEEGNWRPRITIVENVLNSWRQRELSEQGKAAFERSCLVCGTWPLCCIRLGESLRN